MINFFYISKGSAVTVLRWGRQYYLSSSNDKLSQASISQTTRKLCYRKDDRAMRAI